MRVRTVWTQYGHICIGARKACFFFFFGSPRLCAQFEVQHLSNIAEPLLAAVLCCSSFVVVLMSLGWLLGNSAANPGYGWLWGFLSIIVLTSKRFQQPSLGLWVQTCHESRKRRSSWSLQPRSFLLNQCGATSWGRSHRRGTEHAGALGLDDGWLIMIRSHKGNMSMIY